MQYLPGELRVEARQTLPLLATHNTVRLRFDLEAAEYLHLARPDASFPPVHFAMLADQKRNEARDSVALFKHWESHGGWQITCSESSRRAAIYQAAC